MTARLTIETKGIQETLDSLRSVQKDLRKEANAEIRVAAKKAAGQLADDLRAAAGSSGVPVARRVAGSITVKSDRFPTVVIGGSKRVGVRGAPASALVWGSEHGPRGAVNHFGVAANGGGYWIAPTVQRFETSSAIPIFTRAIEEIARRYRLED